jgi:hypothetical protein
MIIIMIKCPLCWIIIMIKCPHYDYDNNHPTNMNKPSPTSLGRVGQGLCVLTGLLPVLFSFVSTFTIICISLDRYRLIVHSNNGER